ncbi:tetratricopeptide (TPR) repeat protein [Kibdelosporangium banguiense]|uniref:Tetratricopeptide (TPR) repeat protein n=1 Tax=Kibdelosporangium banguiense TaxID=1365924 RepID=A0ABS4TKJ4_9PSEU|nr:tetratricopeptide repeat protein [Kibdelosporangium banguiense]MBP2324930.1 tetratricopeptide (TPR) repeat protein [Kibdelosporangium banguiense]
MGWFTGLRNRRRAEQLVERAATAYWAGGLDEASADLTAALNLLRPTGLDSPGSAACLNWLGRIATDRGRFDDAETLLRQSYFDQAPAAAPPDDHITIATCLNNLAIIQAEQGDLDEQWRLLTRSLAHCEAGQLVVPGMKVLANMGANLLDAGQPGDALGLFEQTLQIARAVADGSPMVADQHGNLCRALIALGGLDRALEHAQLAVELHEQAHPGSADHGRMLSERATVHHHRGDLAKALADHRQALRTHEAVDGSDVAVAIDLNNIGTVLRAQGDTDAGLTHFQAALQIDRAIAPRSPATATDLSNLGTLHAVTGDLATAARLHAEALDINQECAPASPCSSLGRTACCSPCGRCSIGRQSASWQRSTATSPPV